MMLETDPATVIERMHSAQIASIGIFIVLVGALVLVLRGLSRRARREEEAERLSRAFQEIEEELSKERPR